VPQLRRDFRRYYHVSYDEVDPEEAVDLLLGLPDGSEYVAARCLARSWSPERRVGADIVDAVRELTWALAYDRSKCPEPPRVLRPEQLAARMEERGRAATARERIERGEWEEA